MILRSSLGILLVICLSATSLTARKVPSSKLQNAELDRKCPTLNECPFNAEHCQDDEDCGLTGLCCKSPCGKVCTKQLFTGCQTLRQAASRRAKALGVETKSVRMPRCNKSGGFEPIQCDNEIVSSCWCVDETGFELPGTRAPAAALVNCTAPKACAAHTCRMFCPHGFALQPDGCPLCKCRDPCEDIRCPDSLACHLEELACADPPCPPVPTCKRGRSLDNICPVGDPFRISDTIRPFLCGIELSKPQCPPMYQCLVQPGNDYGVCCPASLQIQKTGMCPSPLEKIEECGPSCTHDLECHSVQKCCNIDQCGNTCIHPKNITECIHQRALSEELAVSERAGRGYVPQCSADGQFEPKQCSRNGLVCWCVDKSGRKLKGSMSAAENVNCSVVESRSHFMGRSININGKQCEALECAAICEYGFKLDEDGCPTCKCDDPCEGYACPEDEECVTVREPSCTDFLCPTLPVCRPKTLYTNPCTEGTPLTDDLTGSPLTCALRNEDSGICPLNYMCTSVPGSTQAVCCPTKQDIQEKQENMNQEVPEDLMRPQTMCEYLASFADSMEGTREGMTLALPSPSCDKDGNYNAQQCYKENCWCVDHFGTEIPKTRAKGNASENCEKLRETVECLDLTCRMGCDYGFAFSEETGCPTCQCRDPCSSVTCGKGEECQLVEVSCKDHYCPPVPACLPKKMGQCPYLIASSSSCDFECNTDMACNGTMRCCNNGCGTQCIEPLLLTSCQHQRSIALHQAMENGIRVGKVFIPTCMDDGSFDPKQCDPATKTCWCVDNRGFEISQTRRGLEEALNCEDSVLAEACPVYNCESECEHGYKLDKNGCRTCECVDPCSKISCRGEGETCRMVKVECVDWPCPSVPMCLPRRENPCQTGEPLKQVSSDSDEFVTCGPDYESCPSSHKCQLSPVGEYAVCCPKPRDVCFEPLDKGSCPFEEEQRNITRYRFNPKSNKCEKFAFSGCLGNHNNFHTEEMCNLVCPVLSQCERLREKNQKAAEKYKKSTFIPRCEPSSGNWEAVQCLEQVGVCWCVNPQGEPLKGTIVRGAEPECNFRQARNRARDRSDVAADTDIVLEELMMQFSAVEEEEEQENQEESDQESGENSPINYELPIRSRCEALNAQCDSNGQFLPAQCDQEICWCVDEAGNQLPNTDTFRRGERLCLPTPVEKVEITVGFKGEHDDITAIPVQNQLSKIVRNLKGTVSEEGFATELSGGMLYVAFSLTGTNKVDVAYRLEQMVMQNRLPGLKPDITRSRFVHKLSSKGPIDVERVIALEHREIVSQSPVSVVAPYHTALIVIAAASAFIISILTVLVILYKRKMSAMKGNDEKPQMPQGEERFMYNRPIYIELPNEKDNNKQHAIRPDIKQTA